ncbi:MAG: IS1595 family transposase, partial [Ignavibacteriae bacterium]|nr:IS1595 family transposase [Ignavibacteriota bacterium]
MSNKYIYRSRISEAKTREIIKYFSVDLNATQISKLSNLSRNSVNNILTALRLRISLLSEQEKPFTGEVEVDESFFGARRQKGKRGRGAYG